MSDPFVLVTGHCGLIGSAAAPLLEKRGLRVVGFDLRGGEGEVGDVRDAAEVEDAVAGAVAVVHLAGVSRVEAAQRDEPGAVRANIVGTWNVIRAARRAKAGGIVYGSSREVHAGLPRVPRGEKKERPVRESDPRVPINVYGQTKAAAENMLEHCSHLHAILRFSNVYGSVDDHPDRVVPAFCRAAVEDGDLVVRGADCAFDFVHVSDAARAVVRAVEAILAGRDLAPQLVVTGRGTSLGDLARLCVATAGGGRIVEEGPRPNDADWFVGDPSLAKQTPHDLGFEARVAIKDGVAELVGAFREKLRR
jgi:nucleoside-diphosphate-sugar epimerase